MEIVAKGKYIRMSSRKVGLVVDLIRGKKALEAVNILKFNSKQAAYEVLKVLSSALANAKNNFNLNEETLEISKATADSGPMLKRGRFISRGRWHKILKRTTHITIGLKEVSSKGGSASGGKSEKSPKRSKLAMGQVEVKNEDITEKKERK